MSETYEKEFRGMLREDVPLTALEQTRERLISAISAQLTDQDVEFLLSFKSGKAQWDLLPLQGVSDLPAIKWKLQNIAKIPPQKHIEAQDKLKSVLEKLQAGELPNVQ